MLTVSSTSCRILLQECERRGINTTQLLVDIGIEPLTLADADARITTTQMESIWREAHLRAGDESLALAAAQLISPRSYSIMHHIAAASGNVREGLDSVCRYFDLVNPNVEIKLFADEAPPRLEFRHRTSSKALTREYVEFTFAGIMIVFRDTAGLRWKPVQVHLTHRAPSDTTLGRSTFGCEVHYESPRNEIILDPLELLISHPGDPQLFGILTQYARDRLEKLPRGIGLVQEVRTILSHLLSAGEPSLKETAKKMGIGPRTLQRRLKEDGIFFQTILNEYRYELARQMLQRQNLPVSDVSFLLGFSEPSSFYKAFKRWTDKSPESYRKV